MRRLRRTFVASVVVIALAAGGAILWLRESLPPIEGSVALAGIDAVVEIIRDRDGIPHIFAQSAEDAYYGLG